MPPLCRPSLKGHDYIICCICNSKNYTPHTTSNSAVACCRSIQHNVESRSQQFRWKLYKSHATCCCVASVEYRLKKGYYKWSSNLTLCFIASSAKDVWLEFQFWNKKGSSKKIRMSVAWLASMSRYTIWGYLRIYLKNRRKIEFMK